MAGPALPTHPPRTMLAGQRRRVEADRFKRAFNTSLVAREEHFYVRVCFVASARPLHLALLAVYKLVAA